MIRTPALNFEIAKVQGEPAIGVLHCINSSRPELFASTV